jgi:hypothetical protein
LAFSRNCCRTARSLSSTASRSPSPGLSLTCAETGRGGLKIAGTNGLRAFWNSTAHFTSRPQFEIILHEQQHEIETLEFEKVLIHCVSLDARLCYAIETKVLPGKFDIARAKELGVPIGPLLGQLQSGKSVTLADGRTVAPEEVMAPSERPRFSLIICNCSPSLSPLLISHPFWTRSVMPSSQPHPRQVLRERRRLRAAGLCGAYEPLLHHPGT